MRYSILALICMIIGAVSAFPAAPAPAPAAVVPPPPGPFTTILQAGGAVAAAQAQDFATLFSIPFTAADTAFGVSQKQIERFLAAMFAFGAAGK